MNGHQRKQFRSELGTMILLITPFLALLIVWGGVMGFLLRRPAPPIVREQGQPPATDVKTLQAEVEELQVQLDNLQEADSRSFDLVLASLGSLVAVAVIVPAAATISQTLSTRNERNRIKEGIRKELENWIGQEIGSLAEYLLMNDYKLSRVVANEVHVEDVKRIIEDVKEDIKEDVKELAHMHEEEFKEDYFLEIRYQDIIRGNLKKRLIKPKELMKLEIHKYPLVLDDIIKVLHIHENLSKSSYLRSNELIPLLKSQIHDFLLLLMVMTYPNENESDTMYIFPRLTQRQIHDFQAVFGKLKDFLKDKVKDKYLGVNEDAAYSIKAIDLIDEILLDRNREGVRREFNFTKFSTR
jgi:hypothetical protein